MKKGRDAADRPENADAAAATTATTFRWNVAVVDSTTDDGNAAPIIVHDFRPNDVLLGRGAPIIRYGGNIKFRALIRKRKSEYAAAQRRVEKDVIAYSIVQEIARRNGRFLQRITVPTTADGSTTAAGGGGDAPSSPPTTLWKIAERDVAMEKIKQALREKDLTGRQQPPPGEDEDSGLRQSSTRTNTTRGRSSGIGTTASSAVSGLIPPPPSFRLSPPPPPFGLDTSQQQQFLFGGPMHLPPMLQPPSFFAQGPYQGIGGGLSAEQQQLHQHRAAAGQFPPLLVSTLPPSFSAATSSSNSFPIVVEQQADNNIANPSALHTLMLQQRELTAASLMQELQQQLQQHPAAAHHPPAPTMMYPGSASAAAAVSINPVFASSPHDPLTMGVGVGGSDSSWSTMQVGTTGTTTLRDPRLASYSDAALESLLAEQRARTLYLRNHLSQLQRQLHQGNVVVGLTGLGGVAMPQPPPGMAPLLDVIDPAATTAASWPFDPSGGAMVPGDAAMTFRRLLRGTDDDYETILGDNSKEDPSMSLRRHGTSARGNLKRDEEEEELEPEAQRFAGEHAQRPTAERGDGGGGGDDPLNRYADSLSVLGHDDEEDEEDDDDSFVAAAAVAAAETKREGPP